MPEWKSWFVGCCSSHRKNGSLEWKMEKRHRDRWREAKRPFHIDWFFSSTLSYLACPTVPSPDETKEEPIFGIASQLEVASKETILLPHFLGRATFIPTRLPIR